MAKPLKIVIDTNLWISFVISKKHSFLDEHLFSGRLRLLFSSELLDEIRKTIQKPKLQKYFKEDAFDEMFTKFDFFIDLIEVRSKTEICRDIKDNFLLSLAKDGDADFLLTGDNDLLEINKFGKTKIVKFTDFIQLI